MATKRAAGKSTKKRAGSSMRGTARAIVSQRKSTKSAEVALKETQHIFYCPADGVDALRITVSIAPVRSDYMAQLVLNPGTPPKTK